MGQHAWGIVEGPTENLRHATSEERVGAELVEPLLGNMAEAISRRRRQRAYRDVTSDPLLSADEEEGQEMAPRGPVPVSISRADTADPGTGVPTTPSRTSGPLSTVEEELEQDDGARTPASADAEVRPTTGEDGTGARGRMITGDAPPECARVRSRTPPLVQEGGSSSSAGTVVPYGLNPVSLPRADGQESTGPKRARHLYVMFSESCDDFPLVQDGSSFTAEEEGSFAYYVPDDRSFVVAKKRSDELSRNQIGPQEWPMFQEAIKKEVPEVLKSMRILTMEEVLASCETSRTASSPAVTTSDGSPWMKEARLSRCRKLDGS